MSLRWQWWLWILILSLLSYASSIFDFQAFIFNPRENGSNDIFWVKPMYFFKKISILIVDDCIWETRGSDIVSTKLGVPLTIELEYLKAPLFLMFEGIEDSFEVSAVWALGGEVLDKFEAGSIIGDFINEFLIADEVGIGHVPFLAVWNKDQ